MSDSSRIKTWAEQLQDGGNLCLIRPNRLRLAEAAVEFMDMVADGTAIEAKEPQDWPPHPGNHAYPV